MATQKFYRVVDPTAEPVGKVIKTTELLPSPKVQNTLLYKALWKEVVNFWRTNNCQLLTPCHVIVKYNVLVMLELNNLADHLVKNGKQTFNGNLLYSTETATIDTQSFLQLLSVVRTYPFNESIWLIWEYLWEDYRQNNLRTKPSRMDSIFLFDDYQNAQSFYQKMGNPILQIHEVNIIQAQVLESFDMAIVDDIPLSATYNDFLITASDYWQQKKTTHCVNEWLFQGTYELI